MKKLFIILLACMMICSFSLAVYADGIIGNIDITDEPITSPDDTVDYVENEIVLSTNYYVDLSEYEGAGPFEFNGVYITDIKPLFFEHTEEKIAERIEKRGPVFPYCITIVSTMEEQTAIDILNANENIILAELNEIIAYADPIIDEEPIDNSNISNGGLDGTSSTTATTSTDQWAHTYLRMDDVWAAGFSGSSDIKVAVLDTGFVQHADFNDNLNMSLAKDITDGGINVSTNDDHGNKVASVIGSDYDDDVGVNGICKDVTIIPVKICLDNSGSAGYTNMVLGVEYAISQGADVINLSFALGKDPDGLRTKIGNAQVLFVTTAGNAGTEYNNVGQDMSIPVECTGKRHDDPYWIVVGASNQDSTKRGSSHYSSRYCDLFAPGTSVNVVGLTATATTSSGTSIAAPHVAAACALIMSKATHLTPLQVKNLIMSNVTVTTGYNNYCVSGGILNIYAAIVALYDENRGQYGSYTKGDINNNGRIDANDYLLAQRIFNGTYSANASQLNATDVNNNGSVDARDYLLIKRYFYKTYYFPPV